MKIIIIIIGLLINFGYSQFKSADEVLNSVIDGVFDSFVTTSNSHHELHEGNHFEIAGVMDLGLNDTSIVVIDVSDSTKAPHLLYCLNGLASYSVEFFTGGAYLRAPDVLTVVNNNMRSGNTSATDSIFIIHNDSTLVARYGTSIFGGPFTVGAGQTIGGTLSREIELILPLDSLFMMKVTSLTASNKIIFELPWYEHIPKNLGD